MARRKSGSETPERSKIVRERDTAFAKRTRTPGDLSDDDKAEADDDDVGTTEEPTKPGIDPSAADTSSMTAARDTKELPKIEPPPPRAEPWPDATPQPMKPVEARAKTETVAIPKGLDIGRPPEMPKTTAPPPLALGHVESPAHMPGPRDIPGGSPDDPAPAPGRVPPGDSRSLRRSGERQEFALIYRIATYVISRTGILGTRGQWRVVEYPTSAAASHSYAKECSRFVSEGFSDYRD
jgi:hypothetical protein